LIHTHIHTRTHTHTHLRLERSFIFVSLVARLAAPRVIMLSTSWGVETST